MLMKFVVVKRRPDWSGWTCPTQRLHSLFSDATYTASRVIDQELKSESVPEPVYSQISVELRQQFEPDKVVRVEHPETGAHIVDVMCASVVIPAIDTEGSE